MNTLPYITGKGKNSTLIVDGKPICLRSGEIHNSSASSLEYMEKKIWPVLRGRHLNALIVPVYWECIEPEEGCFDFTLVDGLLQQARREGMRLELLWFGLWKNSGSTYVPQWVKSDRQRFWYTRTEEGKFNYYYGGITFILSPFCREAVEADRRAFVQLMRHLKTTDPDNTVIAIQVENEIGVLGARRDYSKEAQLHFAEPVPQPLAEEFGVSGSWKEAFGDYAEEAFMCWYYALAVEEITAAGKAEKNLPMLVNAWLEQEPWIPGTYPSGGPQYKNHRIWRLAAPSIDVLCPDIYVPHYKAVCDEYGTEDNPLFIPETRSETAFYLYAVGQHNALCFAPFGIEDVAGDLTQLDAQTLAMLRIGTDVVDAIQTNNQQLFRAYGLVEGMEDIIRKAHSDDRCRGFLFSGEKKETVPLRKVNLDITYSLVGEGLPVGGGMVVELGDYEFLVMAINCSFDFRAPEGTVLDTLMKDEGVYRNGQWFRGRILNGDERYHHSIGNTVTLNRFKLLPVEE